MDVDGPPAPAAKLPDAVLLQTFTGHSERLGHVDFHPSGHFFATTSFDSTWRLWDVETAAELLLQDGHAFETYAVSFQGDGALVATGDFGGVAHVWDLRSGRRLWSALGHGKKVLCAAWSPDGYTLATGSDDHTVRIWDLRKRACAYTLPAHSSLVADVRFSPETGEALATCAFDGRVKLWSTRDWYVFLRGRPRGAPMKGHHLGRRSRRSPRTTGNALPSISSTTAASSRRALTARSRSGTRKTPRKPPATSDQPARDPA
jgi:WD40 repeat protein